MICRNLTLIFHGDNYITRKVIMYLTITRGYDFSLQGFNTGGSYEWSQPLKFKPYFYIIKSNF